MKIKEAENWLLEEGYVRCKEKKSNLIFEAMLWDDDAVILRQAASYPVNLFIISMDVFANHFSPLGELDDSNH